MAKRPRDDEGTVFPPTKLAEPKRAPEVAHGLKRPRDAADPTNGIDLPPARLREPKPGVALAPTEILLTSAQASAVARMTAARDAQSILVTGKAGAGKSVVVRTSTERLKKESWVNFHVTAFMGIAALEVNGTTISSFFGLGMNAGTSDRAFIENLATEIANVKNTKLRYVRERITGAVVVYVDEISVISALVLDNIDLLCRIVRGSEKPFGGIKMIFIGDFFQLPPISKSSDPTYRFAFQSRAWAAAKVATIELPGTHRQGAGEFADLLSRVRVGEVTPEDVELLRTRVLPPPDDGQIITYLFPRNFEVDAMNARCLMALPGPELVYDALDWQDPEIKFDVHKDFRAGKRITLKVDTQVMLMRNMRREDLAGVGCFLPEDRLGADVADDLVQLLQGSPALKQDVILANGSVGRVVRFERGPGDISPQPVVRFVRRHGGAPLEVRIVAHRFERGGDNPRKPPIATRLQLPLLLCYAISVHKAQGQTIQTAVVIDLVRSFEKGMPYVALSRVISFDQLFLANLDPAVFTADAAVKEFYARPQVGEQAISC